MVNLFLDRLTLEELKELSVQVASAINTYESRKKVIRVKRAPDGYCGDLNCVEILYDVDLDREFFDEDDKFLVLKDGVACAILQVYRGTHGRIKAEKIYPLPGWELEWVS